MNCSDKIKESKIEASDAIFSALRKFTSETGLICGRIRFDTSVATDSMTYEVTAVQYHSLKIDVECSVSI